MSSSSPYRPPGSEEWSPTPLPISVTDAVSKAFEHTKRVLFPFNLGKWMTLGFVAFLASLGEGGGSFNIPDTGSGSSSGSGSGADPVLDWIRSNLQLVITLGVVLVVVGLGIGIALLWVSSRAKLMFVDCVANDRAAVKEPWARFAELGKRLFWFRFWLSIIALLAFAAAAAAGVLLAWPDIQAGSFGSPALTGVLVGVGLILLLSLPLLFVGAVLEDFIVPTMVLHQEPVGPAWDRVKAGIFRGRAGDIVVFYLMKFGLSLAVGMIGALLTCITCCIAAVPYVGTVLLLPLHVFLRSYSLFYIQQFGPEWRFVQAPEPPPY